MNYWAVLVVLIAWLAFLWFAFLGYARFLLGAAQSDEEEE